jgi:hypothetical protein
MRDVPAKIKQPSPSSIERTAVKKEAGSYGRKSNSTMGVCWINESASRRSRIATVSVAWIKLKLAKQFAASFRYGNRPKNVIACVRALFKKLPLRKSSHHWIRWTQSPIIRTTRKRTLPLCMRS